MDIEKLRKKVKMQYRPRDSADRRMYNPERDIAYLTPILMQLTTNSFYEDGAARKELLQLWKWSNEEPASNAKEDTIARFGAMCECIGRGFCQKFMRGEQNFTEALEASGFNKYPQVMRELWLKHFAHTVISAFYYGCRDVLTRGSEEDPMPYNSIFDSAEEIRRYLTGGTDGQAGGKAPDGPVHAEDQ